MFVKHCSRRSRGVVVANTATGIKSYHKCSRVQYCEADCTRGLCGPNLELLKLRLTPDERNYILNY